MKINFLFLGKTKEKYLADGIRDYLKRLQRLATPREIILKEVKPFSCFSEKDEEDAKKKEAKNILDFVQKKEALITLDLKGQNLGSKDFAAWVAESQHNYSTLNFALGNSWGLDSELVKNSTLCISLGAFTWTHEIARFLIVEQVYRAFSILKGLPYHK